MKSLSDTLAGVLSPLGLSTPPAADSAARPHRSGPRRASAAERAAEAYAVLREADPTLPPLPPDAAACVDGIAMPPRQRGPHRRSQPGAAWRVVPKQFWGRLVTALEGFERITRTKGKQGALKQSGVNLYRGIIFGSLNPRTGQCDPSWETLADRSNLGRSTVGDALKRLEAFGLIEHTRRIVPRPIRLMGRIVGRTWEQTSNAYRLGNGNTAAMAQAVPDEAQSLWQQWLTQWQALVQAITAAMQPSESNFPTETTNPLYSRESIDPGSALGGALDRLGEAIRRSVGSIARSDAHGGPPEAAHS